MSVPSRSKVRVILPQLQVGSCHAPGRRKHDPRVKTSDGGARRCRGARLHEALPALPALGRLLVLAASRLLVALAVGVPVALAVRAVVDTGGGGDPRAVRRPRDRLDDLSDALLLGGLRDVGLAPLRRARPRARRSAAGAPARAPSTSARRRGRRPGQGSRCRSTRCRRRASTRDRARARRHGCAMSRSVTTPTSRTPSWTTGSDPTSSDSINPAASRTDVCGSTARVPLS